MRRRLIEIIRDAMFPRRCNACEKLFRPSRRAPLVAAPGDLEALFAAGTTDCFCDACAQAEWVESPMCHLCGLPFVSSQGVDHLCSRCLERPYSFDAARAAGKYQHCLRSMVQDFKYRGHAHLARPLGELLWSALVKYWNPADFDRIIPVPLHRRRMLRRGFNQAELLTRCWPQAARAAGIAFDRAAIAAALMIRQRHTASQTGLDRPQREANLRQAFKLMDMNRVRGQHILLVDDVLTTGATADACSRALKRAGAATVKVLTLARAV